MNQEKARGQPRGDPGLAQNILWSLCIVKEMEVKRLDEEFAKAKVQFY